MALIIHKYLFEKLANHPEWLAFRETFGVLSGCGVELQEGGGVRRQTAVKIDVRGVLVGVLVLKGELSGPEREKACAHLLSLAAERFASILAESHVHDHERLPSVILKTCRWIRGRALTQEVRLSEAAAACSFSPGHLSRLFHQSTGLTFQEYVKRFRLEKACELLASTDQSVTRIACDAGFQSISQFHRSFKAVYGEPPTAWRRKTRGK